MTSICPVPEVDVEVIKIYCDTVFRYIEGNVPVRMIAETGTPPKKPKQWFPNVDQLTALLAGKAGSAAQNTCGVYVVPCTVGSGTSARAENILQTSVVVIDLDTGDIVGKRDHAIHHLGAPTLEIASGGITETGQQKRHLYWGLTEAASGSDLEGVRALRETLAVKLGGDASFKNLAQPIRVAGTIHGKNGTKAPVQILAARALEFELSDLEEAARDMPSLTKELINIDTGQHGTPGPNAASLTTRQIHAGGVDDMTRFKALSKVIGHWIRNARRKTCTLEDAWSAVQDHNAAMIVPPWEDERLHREFQALLRRNIRSNGPMPSTLGENEKQGIAPDKSEDAIAESLALQHGSDLKHVAQWRTWFQWTGQVWSRDETGAVREAVRMICRAIASSCERAPEARRISSDRTITASLRIAASDPGISTRTSDWDAHPMLLNTPIGIIDLETGELLPHDPTLMLTQMTSASPSGDCPLWRTFLAEITGGNMDLLGYLQRLAGYCLTGSTREQSFAFLHGDGANGKSVFLSTIAHVLGDYAATATLDTFMSAPGTRHLTELAGLRAARLVLVPETEQGRSWAEGRIKTVTGGEKIRANFMRQDHFEFIPQFKLVIAGNHRPRLEGCGEAMRRRLHLVPFNVTIAPSDRDLRLEEKLRMERDGILIWMLEGCANWLRIGLSPPDYILEAAKAYFSEEDVVGQWIAEKCSEGPQLRATAKTLFSNWRTWAEETGYPVGSAKSLGDALRQRGFRQTTVNRARGWIGLSLAHCAAAGGAAE
ncbi:phage/plasmid primase, P4 family [Antarctobacter sp.]|uniref:phage/plasmid primase, P4 family n=1 Tax=Antarctobacter sp. TaxID=1872577 RepID=UPI002B27A8B0|nr:phage/plasmid primase, P4 family [Antarctobacter sp.]